MVCSSVLAGAQPAQFVPRQQWGSEPAEISDELLHEPERITLHHSGVLWKEGDDAFKKIKALQSWGQREKHWPDLPYHFLIDPEGRVFEGRELRYRPESNTDYELRGVVNVHLWGDFEQQSVTLAQLRATVELLAWLRQTRGLEKLQTHRQAAPGQTTCPGRDLVRYLEEGLLQRWIEQSCDGQTPQVERLPVLNSKTSGP